MKEIILEICIKREKGKIGDTEAMDQIVSVVIPKKPIKTHQLKRLIAFLYDIEEEELIGGNREERIVIPKILFRTILFESNPCYTEVGILSGVKQYGTIKNSLRRHNDLLATDPKYKSIYQAINTLLTNIH